MAQAGIEVVAVDQSERMVELTAARGIDARVADVQALPFADGEAASVPDFDGTRTVTTSSAVFVAER